MNWIPTWLSFCHTVPFLDWLVFVELVGVVVLYLRSDALEDRSR